MNRKLTLEQKRNNVLKQTLTSAEINRLENYADAKPVTSGELNVIIEQSKKQLRQSA